MRRIFIAAAILLMTVSAVFVVALPAWAATLSVSPGFGEPGHAVVVSGDEFDPSLANCTLHVNTGETPTVSDLVGGCAVDAGGVLTGSFAVPDLPAGNYQVWACNRPGLADCDAGSAETASTGFTIEAPPPDPTTTSTTTTTTITAPSGGGGASTTTTTTTTTSTTTTTVPGATSTSSPVPPAPAPPVAPPPTAANSRRGRVTATTVVTPPPTTLSSTTVETTTSTIVSANVAGVTLVASTVPVPEVVAASGAGFAVSAPQIAIGLGAAAALGGMWVQVRKFKLRRWIKRSSPGWIKRPPL